MKLNKLMITRIVNITVLVIINFKLNKTNINAI